MRYSRDGWSVEAGLEKGRKVPQWFLDEPYVPEVCNFYIAWFWQLSTERQMGMSIGPIPMSKVRDLCDRRGLDDETCRLVEIVFGTMDSVYMTWISDNQQKNTAAKTPPRQNGWGDA